MEAKYGRERLDALEATATSRKWTRSELEDIKKYYKEKINAIERGIDPREPGTGLSMSAMFADISEPETVLYDDDQSYSDTITA